MRKSKKSRKTQKRSNPWAYMLVLAVAFTVSTVVSYFYFHKIFTFESSFMEDIEARRAGTDKNSLKKASSRLYETRNEDLSVKGDVILRKDELLVEAENIIRQHFEPYKVRLLDLYMDKQGIIYIDIGSELKRSFKGDAFEELTVIAGLYKKIKSTIPDFTAMMILIEGRETDSFGGHIDISRPIGEQIAEVI